MPVICLLIKRKAPQVVDYNGLAEPLWCPEQDSNLHASRHAHLKRARLPFRHLGIAFWLCKVTIFFLSNKHRWNFFNDLFGIFSGRVKVFGKGVRGNREGGEAGQSGRTNWVNGDGLAWEAPPDQHDSVNRSAGWD